MHHRNFSIHFVIRCFPYRIPNPCHLGVLGRCWPGNLAAAAATATADGGTPPSQNVAETVKLLKRLGYPDAQEVRTSSSLLTKINQSITKRLGNWKRQSSYCQTLGHHSHSWLRRISVVWFWPFSECVKGWSPKWLYFNLSFIGSLSTPAL